MDGFAKKRLDGLAGMVNSRLEEIKQKVLEKAGAQADIIEAMWYSLSAGGKRIRPVLVL